MEDNRVLMLFKPTLHVLLLKPKRLPTQQATAPLFAAMARQQRLHVSSFLLPIKLTVEDKPYNKKPHKLLHSVPSQQHLTQYIKIFTSQILNLTSSLQDLPVCNFQGFKRVYLTYGQYNTEANQRQCEQTPHSSQGMVFSPLPNHLVVLQLSHFI